MKMKLVCFMLCVGLLTTIICPMRTFAVDNRVTTESESYGIMNNENIAAETEANKEENIVSETEITIDSSDMETDINTEISSEDKESIEGEILYNETETEFITVPETETVKESDKAINKETEKSNSKNDVKNNAEEAKVGDVFRTYFGKFQILTVGDNPTVAIIGDEQMDDDGNFWYGDPSQPWTAIYLDVTYAVTTISCHISGNTVAIPEGVEYIDNQVFKFNATKNLILPSTLKQFDEDHALEYLETITVAEGNQYYKSVDNVLFTKDGKKLLLYPAKDSRECYSTPEETETIAYGAFYKNHNLKILDLTNIKTIEKHSIYGMQNIETIKMASSLENFDPTYNFYQCDTLQNVYVDKENPYYFDDEGVFYFKNGGRYNLVCYPASHNLASYKIPYGVNTIVQFAFSQTSLTSEIIVPSTVTLIATGAFTETKIPMDVVIQYATRRSPSQGAFEKFCPGSRIFVATDAIKNSFRKDICMNNWVTDTGILLQVDYERAVSRVDNWYIKNGKTYYYDTDSKLVHGMYKVDEYSTYFFDSEGVMQTGFIANKVDEKLYYFDPDKGGIMHKRIGMCEFHGKKYWFNDDNSVYLEKELKAYGMTYYFSTTTGEIICDSDSHKYGAWSVTIPATCVRVGVEEHICSQCNTRETTSIPLTSHILGDWNTTGIPTCIKTGERERRCVGCEYQVTEDISMTAHVAGLWVMGKAPTCISAGYRDLKCSFCDTKMKREYLKSVGHKKGSWKITKKPTCTKTGYKEVKCIICNVTIMKANIAKEHSYSAWKTVTAAGGGTAGKKVQTCSKCGKKEYAAIPALKQFSISKASVGKLKYLPFNNKYQSVAPVVKVGNRKLVKNRDYTLSFRSNKYPGKATVKITGKGNYKGCKNISFYIVPKPPVLVNIKSIKKGSVVVKYNHATGASGYDINISASSKFKGAKTYTTSFSSKTISRLSSRKTYYVRIRSYITVGGKKYYGAYCMVKKIKIR